MNFHVLTLFPEMIMQGMNTSITGRAINNGYLSIEAINIRDFAFNKHNKVDDYPYGGGAGMLMQAEPVYLAYESIVEKIGRKPRVVYLTPQGSVFNQTMAREMALEEDLVFLCGHYEGIDERVLEEIVTDYVSIGDYVLTGGELPAMVMMDSISRMVPGVLSNQESGETESFAGNLLEHPHYSRPEVWHGKRVPDVLLSGHHANIEKWRREQSIIRTALRRKDLLKKADLTNKEWAFVKQMLKEMKQKNDETTNCKMTDYEIENREMKNHEIENREMKNHEIENREMKNHEIENHEMKNHEIENHEMNNCEIKNHEVNNCEIKNHEMKNHEIENYEVKNHEIQNHDEAVEETHAFVDANAVSEKEQVDENI